MHTHMCVYVCAHMYHDIMRRSKVNVWELSLTFHHEGPEIELRPSSLVVRQAFLQAPLQYFTVVSLVDNFACFLVYLPQQNLPSPSPAQAKL